MTEPLKSRPLPRGIIFTAGGLLIGSTVATILISRPPSRVQRSTSPAGWAASAEVGSTAVTRTALEHFLNHHPLLEEQLRSAPTPDSAELRQRLPAWNAFAASHPDAAGFLARHPDLLVLRALRRMTAPPMSAAEEMSLAEFLGAHPDVERAFALRPDLARAPEFYAGHTEYVRFLDTHAALAARLGHASAARQAR